MSEYKWQIPPEGGHMDAADGIYFQNMTMLEVEERLKVNDVLIIPVGSTEAHGPHACYGEDTFLVTRMAEAVAKRTGCTVSQPVWFGSHPYHHLGMPGTVPVDEDTFTAYLSSIIAGFWNTGFRKQILLNGHGQEYVIPTAIHRFGKRYQVPSILINLNWYYAIQPYVKDKAHGGPFDTPFVHADEAETSFSLALFPEMINMEDAVDTEFQASCRRATWTRPATPTSAPYPGTPTWGWGPSRSLAIRKALWAKPPWPMRKRLGRALKRYWTI